MINLIYKIKNWIYKKHVVEVEVNKLIGYQSIIRDRAIDIVSENYPEYDIYDIINKLSNEYIRIALGQPEIDDVITFANEYGCTVDYLLGRTDTPYYTL